MRPEGGFSLLELLVTLLVIVVIISLATLNTGSGALERRLADDVAHLAAVAEYARDEATLSGRDYGLLLGRERRDGSEMTVLRWRERRPEGWQRPREGAEIFDPLLFSEDLLLELTLEGVLVSLDRGGDAVAPPAPQVVFYASGEATPGSLTWRRRGSGDFLWRMRWDLLGRIRTSDDPLEDRDD